MLQVLKFVALMCFCYYTFAQPTLTSQETYQYLEPLVVTWENPTRAPTDEIYYFSRANPENKVLGELPGGATSGNVTFPGILPGNWTFGYSVANETSATFDFTVVADIVLGAPAEVLMGQSFNVSFETSPFHSADDYIAIYNNQSNSSVPEITARVPLGASGEVLIEGSTVYFPWFRVVYKISGVNDSISYGNSPLVANLGAITVNSLAEFGRSDNITIVYINPFIANQTADVIYLFPGNYSTANLPGSNMIVAERRPDEVKVGEVSFGPDRNLWHVGTYTVAYKHLDDYVSSHTFAVVPTNGANSIIPSSFLVLVSLFVFTQYFM